MMKKIAYISGNRADFGLMTPILQAIQKSKKLELRLYTTGTHFMPEFGGTINIVKKLFPNVKEIPVAFEYNIVPPFDKACLQYPDQKKLKIKLQE